MSANGRMPPNQFAWSDGQSGTMATVLDSGVHEVIVTDAEACSNPCSVVIQGNELPNSEITGVNTSSGEVNGIGRQRR